jgi:hypothetical protein
MHRAVAFSFFVRQGSKEEMMTQQEIDYAVAAATGESYRQYPSPRIRIGRRIRSHV